jgi:DnaB-like helicase C terminal domain
MGVIVVDYLQLMTGKRTETRQIEIAEVARCLKQLARELCPWPRQHQSPAQLSHGQVGLPKLGDHPDPPRVHPPAESDRKSPCRWLCANHNLTLGLLRQRSDHTDRPVLCPTAPPVSSSSDGRGRSVHLSTYEMPDHTLHGIPIGAYATTTVSDAQTPADQQDARQGVPSPTRANRTRTRSRQGVSIRSARPAHQQACLPH